MVHGIGQRLEKSNLVDDVGSFCQLTASLAEQHLTSHQRGTQRVLYIPCQVSIHYFNQFLHHVGLICFPLKFMSCDINCIMYLLILSIREFISME